MFQKDYSNLLFGYSSLKALQKTIALQIVYVGFRSVNFKDQLSHSKDDSIEVI